VPKKKSNVFISHSSANKEIAEQLCVFLTQIGVKQKHIFCSSIIGNGVDNGEKLGDAIQKAIGKSSLIVFLLSSDFIRSSYCMEELGIGWYLSQRKEAKCYYLILPDLELAELQGFVNSKIDKFTFIDDSKHDELNLFVENICTALDLKPPKPSAVAHYESVFYSAVKYKLDCLINEKERQLEEAWATERLIERQRKEIERLENSLHNFAQENEIKNKQIKLNTIYHLFFRLGLTGGLSKEAYNAISKLLWFDMAKSYEDLMKDLNLEPDSADMELLLASIYSNAGISDQALEHLLNFIKLHDGAIYTWQLENTLNNYHGSLQEVIQLLREKAISTKDIPMRQSYLETAVELEKRKQKFPKLL